MYASRLHDMDRLPLDSAQLQKPCPYPGLLAPWYAQAACTSRQMTSHAPRRQASLCYRLSAKMTALAPCSTLAAADLGRTSTVRWSQNRKLKL